VQTRNTRVCAHKSPTLPTTDDRPAHSMSNGYSVQNELNLGLTVTQYSFDKSVCAIIAEKRVKYAERVEIHECSHATNTEKQKKLVRYCVQVSQ